VTDKRPFNSVLSPSLNRPAGHTLANVCCPHISYVLESVRAHTNTHAGLGRSFFVFHPKQSWGDEGARIFLLGSSVLLFSYPYRSPFIHWKKDENEKKMIDFKRPLRRDEGESLFFFFSDQQRLKGGRKDFGGGELREIWKTYDTNNIYEK
jgi:hypothetical protein